MFKFNATDEASFAVLQSFTYADGAYPHSKLVLAIDGTFNGTTSEGGANGAGTVFQFVPGGAFTTLHSFNYSDGYYPWAGLVQGADNNFYGTTLSGGLSGAGTVFQVTPAGIHTLLHSFSYSDTDGAYPRAALIQGENGNLFGATEQGGFNRGTVFEMSTTGTLATRDRFVSMNGLSPYGGVTYAADGNLYGTTRKAGRAIEEPCSR